VLALENFIKFCNPVNDIRQILRNVIADLQVFGDAFIEVVWWGKIPVAIYNQDCPTTTPLADEHGVVTGYVQVTDTGKRATFEPKEIIHISLDAARPGVFGVSPTQAAMLPITSWLFFAACGKEMARKGLPANVHADLPASMAEPEIRKWRDSYAAGNLGVKNIGRPITTKGGGKLNELQSGKVSDVLAAKNQARDETISCYGVPPSKVSIIESGNLGGGTGESQDRSYHIDTCDPIGELVIEKLQFSIAVQGFGVKDWHLKFPEVDYRDSKVVEDIRDERLRNGAWTLNKYRAEIGEGPVDGGDDPVLVDRQNLVLWQDMAAMSKATVAGMGAPGVAAGETPPGGEPLAGADAAQPPGQLPTLPAETLRARQMATYQRRLREALKRLPVTETAPSADVTGRAVYDQLARDFPPEAIAWVREAEWEGPMRVGPDHIDTANRDKWAASHDGRTAGFAAKLKRKQQAGGELKPAVYVRTPGRSKDIVVDGHHRTLAYLDAGQSPYAYVGRVKTETGPWDELHDRQYPEHSHDDAEEAAWPAETAAEVSPPAAHRTVPAVNTLNVP
jgi:hypothetical protein